MTEHILKGGSRRQKPVGRPSKREDLLLQSKTFDYVLTHLFGNEVRLIAPEEIEQQFGLSRTRAKSILTSLASSLARIKASPAGLRLVDDTSSYYWSQTTVNSFLKQLVGQTVAEMVPPRASIACSPGTTVAPAIADVLEAKKFVNVMTNSCAVLDHVTHLDQVRLDFTGGEYDRVIHACVGNTVVEAFRNAHFSHALIGVSGVDKYGNMFVKHRQEVEILRQIMESTTEQIYVLATIDKLAQADMWCFGAIGELEKSRPRRRVLVVTNPIGLFPRVEEHGDGAKQIAEETSISLRTHLCLTGNG